MRFSYSGDTHKARIGTCSVRSAARETSHLYYTGLMLWSAGTSNATDWQGAGTL